MEKSIKPETGYKDLYYKSREQLNILFIMNVM